LIVRAIKKILPNRTWCNSPSYLQNCLHVLRTVGLVMCCNVQCVSAAHAYVVGRRCCRAIKWGSGDVYSGGLAWLPVGGGEEGRSHWAVSRIIDGRCSARQAVGVSTTALPCHCQHFCVCHSPARLAEPCAAIEELSLCQRRHRDDFNVALLVQH